MTHARFVDFENDPLIVRSYAQFADDGTYTLIFTDVKEAHAWLVRFSRAAARERAKAEKAFDLEGREQAMNFTTRRKGAEVTVKYIPKTCSIIGDRGGAIEC
jgi:hypothetical protein